MTSDTLDFIITLSEFSTRAQIKYVAYHGTCVLEMNGLRKDYLEITRFQGLIHLFYDYTDRSSPPMAGNNGLTYDFLERPRRGEIGTGTIPLTSSGSSSIVLL